MNEKNMQAIEYVCVYLFLLLHSWQTSADGFFFFCTFCIFVFFCHGA